MAHFPNIEQLFKIKKNGHSKLDKISDLYKDYKYILNKAYCPKK